MGEGIGRTRSGSGTPQLRRTESDTNVTPPQTSEVKKQEDVQKTEPKPQLKSESSFGSVSNETSQQKLSDSGGLNYSNLKLDDKTSRAPRTKRGGVTMGLKKKSSGDLQQTQNTTTTTTQPQNQVNNQVQPQHNNQVQVQPQNNNQVQVQPQNDNQVQQNQGGWQRPQLTRVRNRGVQLDPQMQTAREQIGKLDKIIGRMETDVARLQQEAPTKEAQQGKENLLRRTEQELQNRSGELDQFRQTLPKRPNTQQKLELKQKETEVGQLQQQTESLRGEVKTGRFLRKGLVDKSEELTELKMHRQDLGRVSEKISSGQPVSPFDLEKLRGMTNVDLKHGDPIQQASQALLARSEGLPGLDGFRNIAPDVLRSVAEGRQDSLQTLLQGAKTLAQQNPELQWQCTLRTESDVKRQIEAQLPTLPGQPLSQEEKTRLVDSLYTGLISGGNTSNQDQSRIQLNGQEYQRDRQLGQGVAGTVYLYKNVNDPQDTIAVKEFREDPYNPKQRQGMLQELDGHRQAIGGGQNRNPNVTDMLGVVRVNDNKLLVALECLPGGDLQNLNDRMLRGNLSLDQTLLSTQYVMRGAFEGLKHVHDQGMLHIDIKPDNFMLDPNTLKPKICDFGTAQTSSTTVVNFPEGTTRYQSPEIGKGSTMNAQPINAKSDVFSLGVMMFEMIQGQSPWGSNPAGQVGKMDEHSSNPNNRLFPDEGGQPYRNLINQMTHPDPNQRPTMDQVLQHPFFSQNLGTENQAKQILQNLPN